MGGTSAAPLLRTIMKMVTRRYGEQTRRSGGVSRSGGCKPGGAGRTPPRPPTPVTRPATEAGQAAGPGTGPGPAAAAVIGGPATRPAAGARRRRAG
ncbi:hypothetical protein GCM10018953_34400 [Streptosporangium nondiastaticum]